MKTRRILSNILFGVVVTLLSVALIAVLYCKIVGIQAYAVMSGSMEPEIPVNSVVVSVPVKSIDDLKVGDDITYTLRTAEQTTLVTHRIVALEPEYVSTSTDGIPIIGRVKTHGISNPESAVEDVLYANIVGRVEFVFIGWGSIVTTLTSRVGKVISIVAIIVVLAFMWLISIYISSSGKAKSDAVEGDTAAAVPGDPASEIAGEDLVYQQDSGAAAGSLPTCAETITE